MNETYHLWSYFINKGFKRPILDISKKKNSNFRYLEHIWFLFLKTNIENKF